MKCTKREDLIAGANTLAALPFPSPLLLSLLFHLGFACSYLATKSSRARPLNSLRASQCASFIAAACSTVLIIFVVVAGGACVGGSFFSYIFVSGGALSGSCEQGSRAGGLGSVRAYAFYFFGARGVMVLIVRG